MNITKAQYYNSHLSNEEHTFIKAVIDGEEWFVPLDPENTHYAEILAQVKAGILTIKDAD